jgi:molybdopterin synthase catalytic subunit
LAPLVPQALVAVNREFAFNADPIRAADEVALFPPVSGGAGDGEADIVAITPDAIDLNALQRAVTTDRDGAVVLFTGTVRAISGDAVTTRLEYEAYQEMAEAKLRQVAREMRERFEGIHGIALVQRVGRMEIGEPTVAVVVSTGHRGDGAFEAARYGIDRLKQIVPVWKRETRPDGSSWIEGDYVPGPADRGAS